MSARRDPHRVLAEHLAPYLPADTRGRHTKISISLPTDLLEELRAAAAENGATVSATIAAAVRRTLDDAEQGRLDAALALDAGENIEWARVYAPTATRLLSDIEW